jgi:hypothetical protein
VPWVWYTMWPSTRQAAVDPLLSDGWRSTCSAHARRDARSHSTPTCRTRSSTAQTASTLSTPDALVAVLDPDILVREDTGTGTIVQVHGAENVARRAAAVSRLGLVGRPALINGAAGWVSLLDGDVFAIVALTLQNGRITTMDILLDPARLARLDLTAFASRP